MTPTLTESNIENIVLGWFGEFGYAHFMALILKCIQGVTYPRPVREASDRRQVGGHFG